MASLIVMEAQLVGRLASIIEGVCLLLMRAEASRTVTEAAIREMHRAYGVTLSPSLVRPLVSSLLSLSTKPLHLPALARAAARRVVVTTIHSMCAGATMS